jgi:hypothetical protein
MNAELGLLGATGTLRSFVSLRCVAEMVGKPDCPAFLIAAIGASPASAIEDHVKANLSD